MAELLYGAPEVATDLFAAIPAPIGDPFLVVDLDDGRRVAVLAGLDHQTVAAVAPEVELIDPRERGMFERVKGGMPHREAEFATLTDVLADLGVGAARIPWDFPAALADRLRAGGVALTVAAGAFEDRRRAKTEAQIAGVRRAQAAADAAMGVARDLIKAADPGLTAEAIRAAMQHCCADLGCDLGDDAMVAVNAQAANGHDSGSGPIAAGDHVLVDIWPRDRASRCYADMTRTFTAGDAVPGAELLELWSLCRRALEDVEAAVAPGVQGRALYDLTCEVFEAAGKPTSRSVGGALREGFFHGLGHGVGLDVHEAPGLGLAGDPLVPGDVIAVEPGCYRLGFGGVRLEDLLLVTDDGCEVLTQFPYEL